LRFTKFTPALAVPLLAIACSESPTALVDDATLLASLSGGQWTESITGSGHFITGPLAYNPGVWRTFTMTASKALDGSVDGKFKVVLHLEDGADVVRGRVICFTVKGNTAWVGAHKEGNDPPDVAFQVVDNGEGSGEAPDEVLQVPRSPSGGRDR